MGKASSAKKVARAARAGGRSRRERPKLAFPLALFAVIVLGGLVVFAARTGRTDSAGAEQAPSYRNRDHWHSAYGFYACDKFLPALGESPTDPQGIHTHGDGVIHVHPFGASGSGTRAKMKLFADVNNFSFMDDGWKMPDGTEYRAANGCNGKPAKMAIYRWNLRDPKAPIEVFEKDFENIAFLADGQAYTIAIMPEGTEPPPQPPTSANLDQLGAADGGAAPSGAGVPDISIPTPTTPTPSVPVPSTPTPSEPAPTSPPSSTP